MAMIRRVAGLALAVLAILAGLAFESRYWRWRDCFNELGRCYDPVSEQVFLEQAGIAWGTLAAVAALGAGALLWPRRRP